MIQLYKNGAWLINGTELVEDSPEAKAQIQQKYDKVVPGKEEAGKNTIAYFTGAQYIRQYGRPENQV